jgi:putative membrane protein
MEHIMKPFLISTIALPALSLAAWAQTDTRPLYGYESHMWSGSGWMFLGPLMMILFLAGIVALVVLAVRWMGGPVQGMGAAPLSGKTPLDILRDRFARGEIERDEFEERRRALGE